MSRAHKQFPSDFYMNLMMAFSCRLSPLKDHPNCQVQAARHDRHRVFGALESADYQNASAVRNHQRQQPCKLVPGRYKTSEMFFCVTAFSRFTQLFFFLAIAPAGRVLILVLPANGISMFLRGVQEEWLFLCGRRLSFVPRKKILPEQSRESHGRRWSLN